MFDTLGVNDKSFGKSSSLVASNPAHLIKLLSHRMNPWQFERELLKNAIESGATKAYIGPDWVKVEEDNLYLYTIVDNGCGMSGPEAVDRLRHLLSSGKTLGVDSNFGVGARATCLALSPLGVIYITCKESEWSQVRLFHDPADDEYKLFRFESLEGADEVGEVPAAYKQLASDLGIITEGHGTMVILLGSHPNQDTFVDIVPGDELGVRGHVTAINKRFAEIPESFNLKVQEFSSTEKHKWPTHRKDRSNRKGSDGQTMGMARTIRGYRSYVWDLSESAGSVDVSAVHEGVEMKATVHWHLLAEHGDKPAWLKLPDNLRPLWGRGKKGGAVNAKPHALLGSLPGKVPPGPLGTSALLYKGELYNLSRHHARLSRFGLHLEGTPLHRRVAIFVEPDPSTGVANDPSRSHLLFKDGIKDPPWEGWGQDFYSKFPEELKRLRSTITDGLETRSVSDDIIQTYLGRYLKDVGQSVKPKVGDFSLNIGKKRSKHAPKSNSSNKSKPKSPSKKDKQPVVRWSSDWETDRAAEYYEVTNELMLNLEFSGLDNDVKRNSSRHPEYEEDVIREAVREVYAAQLVTRVVHAGAYKNSPDFSREDLKNMLSAEALTFSLLGAWGVDSALDLILKDKRFKAKKKV